jgi:hypothetical protein
VLNFPYKKIPLHTRRRVLYAKIPRKPLQLISLKGEEDSRSRDDFLDSTELVEELKCTYLTYLL